MPTQYIAVPAAAAQENGQRTGPAGDAGPDLPVPFEVECRFATRRDLYRWQDMNFRRETDCQRTGDAAGAKRAAHRWELIQDELDRRDAVAAEKERKRQARMLTAAAIFRETGQVRA